MVTENGQESPGEILFRAVARGEACDFGEGEESGAAADGGLWGADRTIQAAALHDLCAAGTQGPEVHPRGIRVRGARIAGSFDLTAVEVPVPLSFDGCYFDEPLILD